MESKTNNAAFEQLKILMDHRNSMVLFWTWLNDNPEKMKNLWIPAFALDQINSNYSSDLYNP
jgi:hypothetical protein